MVGRIIGCISCLICAVPFWAIAKYHKNSKDPIGFWSGDTTLKGKVKDVEGYNRKMSAIYYRYAAAFAATALGFLAWPPAGVVLLILDCTVGLWLLYRGYKRALNEHS